MATSFDADFRVFIHNPPSESSAGSPAYRRQNGPSRSGSQEWRTNDRETARRKAQRIAKGSDPDNHAKPDGWISLQQNIDGEYRTVEIFKLIGAGR